MTQAHSLTINEIIKELNIGRATVKFILKRFSQWLPFDRINGDHHYSPRTIPTLIRIRDLLDQGILPSEIENTLTEEPTEELPETDMHLQANPDKDIRMSKDALGFIQSLFTDIKGHQSRIAVAHEKRAEAEERKAVAIEKRAEAEEKKADAMNNIAAALQEMNRQRATDSETWEIAGQAAQALTLAETGSPNDTVETDHDSLLDPELDVEDLFDLIDLEPADMGTDDIQLDDLSLLVDTPGLSTEDQDDLSALIDTVPEEEVPGNELDDLLVNDAPLPEPDDLTRLVDDLSDSQGLDDLSSLVDNDEAAGNESAQELDDLLQLIDTEDTAADIALDDLSLLVSSAPTAPTDATDAPDLDDLSQLVELAVDLPEEDMDDLGALMDESDSQVAQAPMDDLSALVGKPTGKPTGKPVGKPADDNAKPARPSLKPNISPEQDPGKYKAAVMKIIIQLKNQGLSARETTERLNQDQVATLSGKPTWKEKTIQKTYGFIDSAK